MSARWRFLVVVQASVLVAGALFALAFRLGGGLLPLVLAGAAGVVVISVAFMAAYARFVGAPLAAVRAGAERLAAGDDSVRVGAAGGGVLAELSAAFDAASERAGRERVRLAEQVAERTADLRAVLLEVHERSSIVDEVRATLAEAERRKTRFLTNVSHELRTPLNSIVGFLRLLEDGLYESPEEQAEFLANARVCADHLLQMVRGVLDGARLDIGRLVVARALVRPAVVLGEVAAMLDARRREKGLALRVECPAEGTAQTDPVKVRQILINLVGNAIRFTERGEIVLRAHDADGSIRFEVQDTGEGIPAEERERIFERFHQVENAAAAARGGAGMGLSISKDLVELLGGTIGVESAGPGKGARFHFTLPAVRLAEAAGAR